MGYSGVVLLSVLLLLSGRPSTLGVQGQQDSSEPPFSSHKCYDDGFSVHLTCDYTNLILWNSVFIYVSKEDVKLPTPHVNLWAEDEVSFKIEVIRPDNLPFPWASARKEVVSEALLWRLSNQDNYAHTVSETLPTIHMVLCQRLNRCTSNPEDLAPVRIFWLNGEGVQEGKDTLELTHGPKSMSSAWRCFGEMPPKQHNHHSLGNTAIVMQRAIAGIGKSCRAWNWCQGKTRDPPNPALMVSLQERMLQCFKLGPSAPAPSKPPRVLVVNRRISEGRHMSNSGDIVDLIRQKWPDVEVDELRTTGLTMEQQARFYVSASILIQVHGAAQGNFIFLPRNAVIIDIVPRRHEDKHDWARFLVDDFRELNWRLIELPGQAAPLKAAKDGVPIYGHSNDGYYRAKEFADIWDTYLNPDEKHMMLLDGTCLPTLFRIRDENPQMGDVYGICVIGWALWFSVIDVNMADIGIALSEAIALASAPPALALPEATPAQLEKLLPRTESTVAKALDRASERTEGGAKKGVEYSAERPRAGGEQGGAAKGTVSKGSLSQSLTESKGSKAQEEGKGTVSREEEKTSEKASEYFPGSVAETMAQMALRYGTLGSSQNSTIVEETSQTRKRLRPRMMGGKGRLRARKSRRTKPGARTSALLD